jgi:hypothetical protein
MKGARSSSLRAPSLPVSDHVTGLLLDCLRVSPHGTATGDGLRHPTPDDWLRLMILSTRHGVNPLLHGLLEERRTIGGAARPIRPTADTAKFLQRAYVHSKLRHWVERTELALVLGALHAAGVDAIVLKGAHLGEEIYGDGALRPMGDVDLLVRDHRVDDAVHALLAAGYSWSTDLHVGPAGPMDYSRHHHIRRLVKEGQLPIELHRALLAPNSGRVLDLDDIWRTAKPTVIAGVTTLALAPDYLLLYLVLHAATNHGFQVTLLTLMDLAMVARRMDEANWSSFVRLVNAMAAGGLAFATLALVRDLLGAPVPPTVLDALDHSLADEEIVAVLTDAVLDRGMPLPVSYESALAAPRAGDRARLFIRGLFPSRDEMRMRHGLQQGTLALYWQYLRRPSDLLRRHGRRLRALATDPRDARAARRYVRGKASVEQWLTHHGVASPEPHEG